jgi:uncharacterized protein (DUF488 family)
MKTPAAPAKPAAKPPAKPRAKSVTKPSVKPSENPAATPPLTIFTVGHSTHPIGDFVALLQSHGVSQIIDIRTIPKSRRNPQFNSGALAASLRDAGIAYVHVKALGGLRHPKPDSINLAWRNAGFRGYADYMQTPEFAAALERAIELARQRPTALMCAEAVPWRCHRSLVSDALVARGIRVLEIISAAQPKEHELTSFAHVRGHQITYPARSGAQEQQKEMFVED